MRAGYPFAWYGLNVALFFLSLVWINLSKTVIPEVGLMPCEPRKMVVWSRVAQQLETMGRLSLPIYLWHVFPLFLLYGFDIHQTHTLIYYTLSSVSCLIIVLMVSYYEQKWRFADRWFQESVWLNLRSQNGRVASGWSGWFSSEKGVYISSYTFRRRSACKQSLIATEAGAPAQERPLAATGVPKCFRHD